RSAISELHLSARAYHRILKIARTIADLEGVEKIQPPHISEALQYRYLDRDLWRR
ncbi:magnesium chelatase, partial [Candidatus Aerophobetes bacterium]|nr:magnesium chelatase [Candidatus Aerophobetes bacterium]MCD6574140.1 magnesium chelatase [Candidatus Aerophobetes bacterium]